MCRRKMVVAGADYGEEESFVLQKPNLLRIVNNRKLPKGALLVAEIDATL